MPKVDDRARPHIVLLRNVFDNLGDAAMLECEIDALQRHLPRARLTVLSDDHRLAARFPGTTWDQSDIVLGASVRPTTRRIVRAALRTGATNRWRSTATRVLTAVSARRRRSSIRCFVS